MPETVKSAFVAIVGRPNVGKSTLVNAMVGSKVSITSPRPQTTRNAIRGVVHGDDYQLVLIDLPGLHKPRRALGERLNRVVYGTLDEVDGACFVLDATTPIGPGDRRIAARLGDSEARVVVVVNKIDVAPREEVADMLAIASEWDMEAYFPTSATTGRGLDQLEAHLAGMGTDGPAFFPPDVTTDQPEVRLTAEIVREKWLARLEEELPHSLAVVVEEIVTRPNGTVYVDARAVVERESQKGMVIGKGGKLLKTVGSEARRELERLFGADVYLDLRVSVEKDWQSTPALLDRLGF